MYLQNVAGTVNFVHDTQVLMYRYETNLFLSLLLMPVDIPPDSELPSYYNDDSLSLPSYSSQLVNGEQRLDHTPRSQAARSRPSGIYVKNLGKMSVVLDDQEENVTTPVFGRRAVISGNLSLGQEQLDSIRKIVLKVSRSQSFDPC